VSEQFLTKALVEDLTARDFVDLGKLYIALNQDSLGEIQLKRAIAFDPESIEAAQLHAEMLYKSKRYEEAAEAYEKLVEVKDKPSPNEYLNLARAYSISEQYEEADTVYVKLVEQYPTNIQVAVESARVKANIDSTQDDGLAKPLYEKVIELAEASPEKYKVYMIEAYKYMGSYFAIQEGNVSKGKAYFEKVLTLNPEDSQAKEVLEAIRAGQIQSGKKTG
ncbi:MAG TPA: tetratricopeptide repeat protein, partial [Cyclobacteriaceae bacterium]|nr:tetratricopeptide repeat protein [Cyclobacteriaceae bacterium]